MTTRDRPPPDPPSETPSMTPPASSAAALRPVEPLVAAHRHRHPRPAGHGARLTAAFEALERFPALAESRNRVLALVAEDRPSTGEVVAAIESDVALVIAVLRLANQVEGNRHGKVESIVEAVEVLSPEAVQRLAASAETFEFFERGKTWDAAPERFRLHAVAVQRAADRLGRAGRLLAPRPPARHRAAARHRQARAHARLPGLPEPGPRARPHARGAPALRAPRARRRPRPGRRRPRPPLEPPARRRLRDRAPPRRGRRRRCRLRPPGRHGRPLRPGLAGLADRAAARRPRRRLRPDRAARPCSTTCPTRRPRVRARSSRARSRAASSRSSSGSPRAWSTSRSPTSSSLSTSTVRTHLHNIYGKLGAVDRAQAVLIATERGWL